jgi:cell division protein ZapA
MSQSTVPVTVRIMDKEYKISCPEGEHESLLASAKHVSENMKKVREGGKALGAERVAVMAALNITHELLSAQDNGQVDLDLSGKIDSMHSAVQATLSKCQ